MSPVDVGRYQEAVAIIEKKYPGDVKSARDVEAVERVSSGSPQLNWIMKGGVPNGRYVRIYGAFSSAKSLSCLEMIREQQGAGRLCVYYDVEKQFDPDFVLERGIDTDALKVVEGDTIEELGAKIEVLLPAAHVHVIDSVSEATSLDELTAKLTEWRPGLSARSWAKVFHRIHHKFDRSDNTVILVDQIRERIGQKTTKPAGGRLIEHKSSMSIEFRKGSWLYYDKDGILDPDASPGKSMTGDIEPDGVEIKARCEKSRIGRPLQTATLRLDLNSMFFDREFELVEAAKYFGLVEKSGSWYTYHKPKSRTQNGKEMKVQGSKGLRELIRSEHRLVENVWQHCNSRD